MKSPSYLLGLWFGLVAASASAQTLAQYQSTVLSQNPSNYFTLDATLQSAVNPGVVLESFAGGYSTDAYRNISNCWYFVDQNTAFLRILSPVINGGGESNTTSTAKGSISFLFRALSGPNIGGQRTLFDATTVNVGTTNHNAFMLFFENDTSTEDPNSLKLRFGDVTTTIMLSNNVSYGSWYYFALTYDEARVPNKAIWYLARVGGTFSTGMTTNSAESVAGDGSGLLIGQRANFTGAYRSPGSGRIDEFAIWGRELSFLEISNQFARLPLPAPPGAAYDQVVQSQIPKYYFRLNQSLVDSVGNVLSLTTNGTGGEFTTDILGNPLFAYTFSETNDSLVISNDLINGGGPGANTTANAVGTISFLFRMLSDTNNEGPRYLFAAPASSTNRNQLGLFLESANPSSGGNSNSLKLRVGNTTKGNVGVTDPVPVAYPEQLVPNGWHYFAMTYDESRNTPEVYTYFGPIGGTLLTSSFNPANDSVVGDDGPLWIGNRETLASAFRNPGQGVVDEFAIWHEELTPAEIQAQFNALSPASKPELSIQLSGDQLLLSWPASTSAAYTLETTNVLDATTINAAVWPNAGAATVVGDRYFVTNSAGAAAGFYRLHKP